MSLLVPKADDSQGIHSFAQALRQLTARDGQLTPPLESFLAANATKFATCAQPFRTPQAASRSKVDTGKFTAESGEDVLLGEREKDLVKQLSDKLQVDEVEAAVLFKHYRRSRGEDASSDVEASLCRSDDFWEEITVFVLEEQLRIIQIVALLLRSADFEDRIPQEVVQRFASDVTTPQFAQAVLDRACQLATTAVPTSAIPFSPVWAKYWIQQQKALLEVYFLLYYNRLFPNGKSLLSVLQFVESTVWGTQQANEGLFDTEAQALAQDVGALSHLVLIENMNLERAASPEAEEFNLPPGQLPDEDQILNAKTLQSIHRRVLNLVSQHPRQSSLLALSWAFVLFRVTESISSVPLPETYYDVAQEILPVDLHPRKDTPSDHANKTHQAVWQLLATHSISPQISCLSFLHDLLTVPLISSHTSVISIPVPSVDPNVAGYLSVLRSVLASLSRLVHPTYLPAPAFESLVSAFEALYSNPEAGLLRGNFWGLFTESDNNPVRDEEWQILDVAAKRFPAESGPLTRMLLAVSGGRSFNLLEPPTVNDPEPEVAWNDSSLIESRCAEQTVQYLAQPQNLTQELPTISPVMPLPYEPSKSAGAAPTDVVAVRPIKISPSLTIPPGTAGRIVSPFDKKPLIVSWDISRSRDTSLSIFRFYGDAITAFAACLSGTSTKPNPSTTSTKPNPSTTPGDVFETSGTQGVPEALFGTLEEQLSHVTFVVALLRNAMHRVPSKVEQTLLATFGDVHVGLRTFFLILERTAGLDQATALFVLTTNILNVLLRSYPDEILAYMRSSDALFPLDKHAAAPVWGSRTATGSRNILVQDRTTSVYDRTLACLELLEGLVTQAQWSAVTDSESSDARRTVVLKRALQWAVNSVFAGYNTWRYHDLRQKFEIGLRLAATFSILLDESNGRSRSTLSECLPIILQALLVRPGNVQLSALMSIVSTGNTVVGTLQRLGKTADCIVVESCIHRHLQLLNQLLQLSRHTVINGPTMLEKLLFAHCGDSLFQSILPDVSQDSIHILTVYLVNSEHAGIATEAAGILTKLCSLSVDWGPPSERPSFLSHMGSIRDTEAVIRRLLILAGDPFEDLDLQLGTWRLLSAIVASQPGFAALLVTGRQALEPFAATTSQLAGATTGKSNDHTALHLALEVVNGWEEAWRVQPSILSAALTFLLEVWQNYAESSRTLLAMRQEDRIWTSLLGVLQQPCSPQLGRPDSGSQARGSIGLHYAQRRYAQAVAAALYAAELQTPAIPTTSTPKQATSAKLFLGALQDATKLGAYCKNVTETAFNEQQIRQTHDEIAGAFPGLDLDMYTRQRLIDPKPHGDDFLYDTRIVSSRMIGFIGSATCTVETVHQALGSVREANILWSIADAEGAFLRAAVTWVKVGLVRAEVDKEQTHSLQISCQMLLANCSSGRESSAVAEVRYAGILRLGLVMVECLSQPHARCSPEFKFSLLKHLAAVLTSDKFPLDRPASKQLHSYITPALKLAFHAFKIFGHDLAPTSTRTSLDPKRAELAEVCLSSCINTSNCLILAAKGGEGVSLLSEDLVWSAAAICEMLDSTLCPPSSLWVTYCTEKDFFRHSLDYIVATNFDTQNIAIAQSILDLLLAMAKDPHAAEKLALEGVIYSLCNNALTGDLEGGNIGVRSATDGSITHGQSHREIWILFLSIVTQLVCHLGRSTPFMEQEVSTFVQMYRAQLRRTLKWTSQQSLSISELREMRAALTLLSACVNSSHKRAHIPPPVEDLLRASLAILPQLVYLLQHPNLLQSLMVAGTPTESMWLSSDSGRSEAVDVSDLQAHPVIASLCQEVFGLCWLIVSILVAYTGAFNILVRDRVDWPRDRVFIAASANVSLEEPATFGTLFDLARFCTDVTRHCTTTKTNFEYSGLGGPLPPYDITTIREIADQCFEGTLLLMSTQIALIVQQQDMIGTEDRGSQRARRDLKELASDLVEEFLDKSTGQAQARERRLPDVLKVFVLRL